MGLADRISDMEREQAAMAKQLKAALATKQLDLIA